MAAAPTENLLESSIQRVLFDIKVAHLASGRELCDLSMINPDIEPARILIDKLLEATVKSANHRYSVSKGIRKLRSAFQEKYEVAFGVSAVGGVTDPDKNVCITMGTKDAIVNTLMVLDRGANSEKRSSSDVNASEAVLLPAPTYPAHLSAVHIAGLKPIFYPICRTESEILSDIKEKLSAHACKAIILNFPNNPTGHTVSAEFYKQLKKIVQDRGVAVINDYVYGEMTYGTAAQPSLLSVFDADDLAVESYSLSKAYSIPGWRIGALVGNSKIVDRLSRLKSHIDYGIFLPLQIAACSALQNAEIPRLTAEKYNRRFKVLASGLSKLGWQVQTANAGAALWAKMPPSLCEQYGDALSFCKSLLNNNCILLTPGAVFGDEFSEHVRFALVASEEKLFQVTRVLAEIETSDQAQLKKQNAA